MTETTSGPSCTLGLSNLRFQRVHPRQCVNTLFCFSRAFLPLNSVNAPIQQFPNSPQTFGACSSFAFFLVQDSTGALNTQIAAVQLTAIGCHLISVAGQLKAREGFEAGGGVRALMLPAVI